MIKRDAVTVTKARTHDTVTGRIEIFSGGRVTWFSRVFWTASRHFQRYSERRKGSVRGVSEDKRLEGFIMRIGS